VFAASQPAGQPENLRPAPPINPAGTSLTASMDSSVVSLQTQLLEHWKQQAALSKAISIEETTAAKDLNTALTRNKQYTYAQSELSRIPERRDRALEELDSKLAGFRISREAKVRAIRDEMDRHIEAYKARKEEEISALEREVEAKESAIGAKKADVEARYEKQLQDHQGTCERLEDANGSPHSIAYRRKKTELEMLGKQIKETQEALAKAMGLAQQRAQDRARAEMAEAARKEREEREHALQLIRIQREQEREADRRKEEAREARKKKLRAALERCKTAAQVSEVEANEDYLDWEDEELCREFCRKLEAVKA